MHYNQVNPNASFASVAAGKFKNKNLSLLPSLPLENYTFSSPCRQYFSFPYVVMKYILYYSNTPNGLLKLYMTCKYFYLKQQIVCLAIDNYFTKYTKKWKSIMNAKKLKIWLYKELHINYKYSLDFTKIYRATIKELVIGKILTFNDFKIIVAEETVEEFILYPWGSIKNSDNNDVAVDDILQLLPNLRIFKYFNRKDIYSKEKLGKMNIIKNNQKIQQVLLPLNEVPDDFDAHLFFKFLQQIAAPFCEFSLYLAGANRLATKSKLTAAEEKMKSLKEWQDKNFKMKYFICF